MSKAVHYNYSDNRLRKMKVCDQWPTMIEFCYWKVSKAWEQLCLSLWGYLHQLRWVRVTLLSILGPQCLTHRLQSDTESQSKNESQTNLVLLWGSVDCEAIFAHENINTSTNTIASDMAMRPELHSVRFFRVISVAASFDNDCWLSQWKLILQFK